MTRTWRGVGKLASPPVRGAGEKIWAGPGCSHLPAAISVARHHTLDVMHNES